MISERTLKYLSIIVPVITLLLAILLAGCGSVIRYGSVPPLPPVPHGIMECYPQPDGTLLCRNE